MAVNTWYRRIRLALFVANKLGADIGSVIVYDTGRADGLIGRRPAVL